MSPSNEPVAPAQFDVAPAAAQTAPGHTPASGRAPHNWVLPALIVLVLLALLVIFWLPGKIQPTAAPAPTDAGPVAESAPATPPASEAAPQSASVPEEEAASPWADAQQARARLEAQEVLAELIDLQFSLEEQGAKVWAPGALADAAAAAEEGDVLYRNRDYEQATVRYQGALTALQELQAGIPERLQQLLQDTEDALAEGDVALATSSLAAASALDPDNDVLPALEQRVAALPTVLEKLAGARKLESAGDLDAAAALLEEALALDALHKGSAQALDRVRNAMVERDFQVAMSRGYASLDEAEYDAARNYFNEALALKEGSAEASSALLEVDAAQSSNSLAALQRQGAQQQAAEQWAAAVKTYERAQRIDPNVLYASEGLQRSRKRAELDSQFREILEAPERLANTAVAKQASDFLRHAKQISPQGKVLSGQIRELDRLLQLANTPVEVTLRSDMQTDVIVYKVARLGKFDQQALKLRPGEYTAVGTRLGYRDVHMQFKVAHEDASNTVTVICSEPI